MRTYSTRINGAEVVITLREGSTRHFRYESLSEQCEGCGHDQFEIHLDTARKPYCLHCEHCFLMYPLEGVR